MLHLLGGNISKVLNIIPALYCLYGGFLRLRILLSLVHLNFRRFAKPVSFWGARNEFSGRGGSEGEFLREMDTRLLQHALPHLRREQY